MESVNLSSHAIERVDTHLTVITTRLSTLERTVDGSERSPAERCLTDRLRDVEADVRRLGDAVRVGRDGDATLSQPAAAAASGGGGGGDLQSTVEKLTIYEGVITVLNREVEKLSTQVCTSHQSSYMILADESI